MEDLFFKFLTPALTWIPRAYFYLREKFATAGAPGITFVVRPHLRPDNAKFKCKILVDIKNETIPEQPVCLSAAYFIFNKSSPLKPDPKWSREYKTGRFHLYFLPPRQGSMIGATLTFDQAKRRIHGLPLIPRHKDDDIEAAAGAENIGRLYFRITRLTDSGSSKTSRVYRRL